MNTQYSIEEDFDDDEELAYLNSLHENLCYLIWERYKEASPRVAQVVTRVIEGADYTCDNDYDRVWEEAESLAKEYCEQIEESIEEEKWDAVMGILAENDDYDEASVKELVGALYGFKDLEELEEAVLETLKQRETAGKELLQEKEEVELIVDVDL